MAMVHVGERSFYQKVQKRINHARWVLHEGMRQDPGQECNIFWAIFDHDSSADALGLVAQSLVYLKGRTIWSDIGSEALFNHFLQTSFARVKHLDIPNSHIDSKCNQLIWLMNEGLKNQPNHEFTDIDFLADPATVQFQIKNKISEQTDRKRLALVLSNHSDSSEEPFPGFNEVLLIRRNDIVLNKLTEIEYGAAHMPDLEQRFTRQFNYLPSTEQRLVVFNF